jgi:hypothetical protein
MLYISYRLTNSDYNFIFKNLQNFLKQSNKSHQLRRDTWDKDVYITNGLAKYGFQEIRLRKNKWKYLSIEIRLRPKLLIDPKGYYNLTSISEFEEISIGFNYIINDILSLKLPDFFKWNALRVEAAIDLKIDEDIIPKYLYLFKKGNIPEYFLINPQSQKYMDSKTNVYLMSPNKTVNWYNRHETLLEKEKKTHKKYLDFSETKGILRFETQVRNCNELVMDVLNQERCKKEILKFYKQIVGKGNYYNLDCAKKIIREKVNDIQKHIALKNLLILIDKCGSIVEAKKAFIKENKTQDPADTFSKRINQLRKLGINPVVLPSAWKITYLENLYDKIKKTL